MKYYLFLALALFTTTFSLAEDWGKTGHRSVGQIAQDHLTHKTRKVIEKLLDGASLALVANFGDDIKSDKKYRKYNPWHYVNLPLEATYDIEKAHKEGDIIQGIQQCVNVIRDAKASKEDRAFHLKLLVHFIGDLHQPMHIGREEDRGGNDIQLTWFGQKTNLHRVWDSNIIESYGMSFTELAKEMPKLSKKEIKRTQEGTPLDWMEDSHKITKTLYNDLPENGKLGYEYMYTYSLTMRKQIQKGGLRLAKLLNELLGRP